MEFCVPLTLRSDLFEEVYRELGLQKLSSGNPGIRVNTSLTLKLCECQLGHGLQGHRTRAVFGQNMPV